MMRRSPLKNTNSYKNSSKLNKSVKLKLIKNHSSPVKRQNIYNSSIEFNICKGSPYGLFNRKLKRNTSSSKFHNHPYLH